MEVWQPTSPFLQALRLGIPTALVIALLSSCISPGDSGNGSDSEGEGKSGGNGEGSSAESGEVVATSATTSLIYSHFLEIDVYPVERIGNDVALVNMTARNTSDKDIRFFHAISGGGNATTAQGVSIIDTANSKQYLPLMAPDGSKCLCLDWSGDQELGPGDSLDFWVAYPAPPEDIDTVTITTVSTPDFIDIPVIDNTGSNDEVANTETAEPQVLALSSFQDDLDGTTSREDSEDESSIMLASDVLFETDESTLTSKADSALGQVAQEIDDSSTKKVQIDGYTDSTGNDSINDPLSEDRAKAFEDALKDLVTRSGITYETAGHGSADPVADNETEEGRAKNRRVTVTFEK